MTQDQNIPTAPETTGDLRDAPATEHAAALATVTDHMRSFVSTSRVQGARMRVDLTEVPFIGSSTFDVGTLATIAALVEAYLERQGERTDGTEWFWRIVDSAGLGNVPSDEIAALRLLCDRAAKYEATPTTPHPTEDVAALRDALDVAGIAEAINKARYTPDGIPYQSLADSTEREREYSYRLARAAIEHVRTQLAGADTTAGPGSDGGGEDGLGGPVTAEEQAISTAIKDRWDALVGPATRYGAACDVPGSWARASLCDEFARAVAALARRSTPATGGAARLADTIGKKIAEPAFAALSEALRANLTEPGYVLAFKVRPTGTDSMWVRLASGREIIVGESEWTAALDPDPQPQAASEGELPEIPGVDGQVLLAARHLSGAALRRPEWLWHDNATIRTTYGRWAKVEGSAPYVRADLVLAAITPAGRGADDPEWVARAAWCADRILTLLPADLAEEEDTERGLSPGHLKRMAGKLSRREVDGPTKACRWLGWLQAGLVFNGLSGLEAEKQRNLASRVAAPKAAGRGADAGGWRPIETAPKEQQPILLALDRGRYGDISRAPVVGYWRERQGWTEWSDPDRPISANPTHWMPLPAAPTAPTAQGEA